MGVSVSECVHILLATIMRYKEWSSKFLRWLFKWPQNIRREILLNNWCQWRSEPKMFAKTDQEPTQPDRLCPLATSKAFPQNKMENSFGNTHNRMGKIAYRNLLAVGGTKMKMKRKKNSMCKSYLHKSFPQYIQVENGRRSSAFAVAFACVRMQTTKMAIIISI